MKRYTDQKEIKKRKKRVPKKNNHDSELIFTSPKQQPIFSNKKLTIVTEKTFEGSSKKSSRPPKRKRAKRLQESTTFHSTRAQDSKNVEILPKMNIQVVDPKVERIKEKIRNHGKVAEGGNEGRSMIDVLSNYDKLKSEFDEMKEKIEFIFHEKESISQTQKQAQSKAEVQMSKTQDIRRQNTSVQTDNNSPQLSKTQNSESLKKAPQLEVRTHRPLISSSRLEYTSRDRYNSYNSARGNFIQEMEKYKSARNTYSQPENSLFCDHSTTTNHPYLLPQPQQLSFRSHNDTTRELSKYRKLHQKMDQMIQQLCPLQYTEGMRENGIRDLESCWKFSKDIVKELVHQRKRADMLEAEVQCMERERQLYNLR